MDWNDYQRRALTTAIYPKDRALEYTIFGLVSEVAEVAEYIDEDWFRNDAWLNSIRSEVGDCFWYAATVADALGLALHTVATKAAVWHYRELDSAVISLVSASGYMSGLMKKAIRDDAGQVSGDRYNQMVTTLGKIIWILDNICERLGVHRSFVMGANLEKLADRKERGVLQGSGDHR